MKFLKKLVLVVGMMTVIVAAGATIAFANPGTLITTTILGARATLSDNVRVNQDGVKFRTKQPTDVLVQTITFQPQGSSGWHFHPGLVIVVVQSGQVTTHDSRCRTATYGPHQSFIESGTKPFMVSNDSTAVPAVVYATIVVPAGDAFRIETVPPVCA